MTLTQTYARLATATEGQLTAAYRSWQEGDLTESDFYAIAAAYLSAATNRAAGLADLALAAFLTNALGRPVPTLGLVPEAADYRGDLEDAVADQADPEGRVGRTGRAVALAAAQDAYGTGMQKQGVYGWTRVLNSGGCDLCQDLLGDVLPSSARMYHHAGCGCTQEPVLINERNAS